MRTEHNQFDAVRGRSRNPPLLAMGDYYQFLCGVSHGGVPGRDKNRFSCGCQVPAHRSSSKMAGGQVLKLLAMIPAMGSRIA